MTLLNTLVARIRNDEDGQGLVEYALILALIAIVAIVALIFLGGQVDTILNTVALLRLAHRHSAGARAPPRSARRSARLLAQHHDVLVGDVGHERLRVAVRPEARAGLVPDDVALHHEPGAGRARRRGPRP